MQVTLTNPIIPVSINVSMLFSSMLCSDLLFMLAYVR